MSDGWVIDSSVGFSWVHPGQATAATDGLLDALAGGRFMIVPPLWFAEMANGLLVLQRRKKLLAQERKQALQFLEGLALQVDDGSAYDAFHEASDLAEAHGLTVYDAIYLELAIRRKLALATRDEPLRRAARSSGLATL